jgi:hypothetical protein
MDDFLHNLRSGKLKQGDRSNRSYGDQQYKGGPRRNTMDRRKGHYDNKESFERLNAIKEVIEALADTQKRMAEAYQARTLAEERKAKAMEILAKSIYRIANPNASANEADELFATETPRAPVKEIEEPLETARLSEHAEKESFEEEIPDRSVQATADEPQGKLSSSHRRKLNDLIHKMRTEGHSWENIARQISSNGYPTVSGKGKWRGAMVKNMYEKMEG